MTEARREWLGYGLGFVGVVIFGATLPMTRFALRSFDVLTVTVGRAALAGIVAAVLVAALRRRPPMRHLGTLAKIAVMVTVAFPGCMALAMTTVPASHGGVVLGILPLATALAAAWVAGETPSRTFWLYALAGAAIVTGFALRSGPGGLDPGDLWLLCAGAAASLGYALSGRLAREMPGWEVISWVLVVSLPAMLLAMIPLAPRIPWDAPAADWAAFLYLGLMSQFMGFFFWNAGLALGGVARVGQIQLLQTFVTLAISAAILGETLDAVTILAALAVALVVFLGRKAPVGRHAEP
jgi:drug/metabolite transporter (DMT)-like permease